MSNKKQRRTGLPVIHEFAAGIDIDARFHVVAVPTDLAEEPTQTFHTYNGHKFQSRFHWHAANCGIIHRCIKPAKSSASQRQG